MTSLLPARPRRTRALRHAVAACAAALVSVTLAAPTPAHAATQSPADVLRAGMNQGISDGYPGVIGLIRDGDTVTRLSAGTGNRSTGQAADPAAQFRIGSLTKSFTATVLLQLEAEGRLSLDDTVGKWLPGAVNSNGYDGNRITVRQLLNQTSGLPNYFSNYTDDPGYWLGTDLNQSYPPQSLVNAALDSRGPVAQSSPPQAYYANTNYILAGMVIQAVTGDDPAAEITKRVIEPLGLHNTSFPTSDPGLHGNFMYGYMYLGVWPFISLNDRTASNVQMFWTAGAMVSSLDDLNTYYRALLSGALLPAAQTAELETGVPFPQNNATSSYGLGLIHLVHTCADGRQLPLWAHTGGVVGYFSYWISNADGSRQILLAANENHGDEGDAGVTDLNSAAAAAFCAM